MSKGCVYISYTCGSQTLICIVTRVGVLAHESTLVCVCVCVSVCLSVCLSVCVRAQTWLRVSYAVDHYSYLEVSQN